MGRTLATAHTSQPWRIHEFAEGFRLEDVWVLPTPGATAGDFPEFVEMMHSLDLDNGGRSRAARALFAIRWALGRAFGWDDDGERSTRWSPTLRERVPADLAATARGDLDSAPFTALYCLEREYAGEMINSTMHGIVHLGWVADGDGGYRGQMAVLVKPKGWLGQLYMAFIKPFRYAIVYPAMTRHVERAWRSRRDRPVDASAGVELDVGGLHARPQPLPLAHAELGDGRRRDLGDDRDRAAESHPRSVMVLIDEFDGQLPDVAGTALGASPME